LTQAQLAEAAGAKQSAICMFEQGHRQALSDERLQRVFQTLGLDPGAASRSLVAGPTEALKYCRDPECPSNTPFAVGSHRGLKPAMLRSRPDHPTRCPLCGKALEALCPNEACAQPVNEGACCLHCGTHYVPVPPTDGSDARHWAASGRRAIRELRDLSRTRTFAEWSGAAEDSSHATDPDLRE
jgi:hypothetical protein